MFVDEVKIKIEAGTGGDGCTAFRREKYVPMGGPDGGNGGRGGNVIFTVDSGLRTLLDFKSQRLIKADHGGHGSGKNKAGKNAEDTIVKVPPGTVITDLDTNLIVADLLKEEDNVIVALGGRGGRGNKSFATNANPAPNISEKGEPGEVKFLKLELKLIADVGLVGMPNVGKSTILSVISKSKPKIADYHFTTLTPNLGVVQTKDKRSFVVADLPGLIEGASRGHGLGDRFLKHIERTRIIVHVIDMSGQEKRNPYQDYITINKELEEFSPKLIQKPQIILANKMDLPNAPINLKKFKAKVRYGRIFEIVGRENKGLDEVLVILANMLDEIDQTPLYDDEKLERHILYKFNQESPFKIKRYNNIWFVQGEEVERLLKMTKFSSPDAALRFTRKLRRLGIDERLAEMGAKDGDTVRILDFEFTYQKED
jgi:GTP-binding protein